MVVFLFFSQALLMVQIIHPFGFFRAGIIALPQPFCFFQSLLARRPFVKNLLPVLLQIVRRRLTALLSPLFGGPEGLGLG